MMMMMMMTTMTAMTMAQITMNATMATIRSSALYGDSEGKGMSHAV